MIIFLSMILIVLLCIFYEIKEKNTKSKAIKNTEHNLDKEFFCIHCATYKPLEELEKDYSIKGINYLKLTPIGSPYICKKCVKDGLDSRMIELLEERADRIIKWKNLKEKIDGR